MNILFWYNSKCNSVFGTTSFGIENMIFTFFTLHILYIIAGFHAIDGVVRNEPKTYHTFVEKRGYW